MNVLITGASGFIGGHLCAALQGAGHRVVALVRRGRPFPDRVPVPICEYAPDALSETISRFGAKDGLDAVVHAAGKINGSADGLREANEAMTRTVVAGLEQSGADASLVYLSSVSAIGPLGSYGASKRAAEQVIASSNLRRWTILRPSLVYGPGDTKNVARLVEAVRAWPIVPVIGAGGVRLQPLYVGDLCDVIRHVLDGAGEARGIYTVAGPRQERLVDMIRLIRQRLGRRNVLLPLPLRPIQVAVRLARPLLSRTSFPVQQVVTLHDHPAWDAARAVEQLSFRPRRFEEGLSMMIPQVARPAEGIGAAA